MTRQQNLVKHSFLGTHSTSSKSLLIKILNRNSSIHVSHGDIQISTLLVILFAFFISVSKHDFTKIGIKARLNANFVVGLSIRIYQRVQDIDNFYMSIFI